MNNGKLVIPKFDDDAIPKRAFVDGRPQPATTCTVCTKGPALLDDMCEPCWMRVKVEPHLAIKDQLIHKLSIEDTILVNLARKRNEALIQYNKFVAQNHACQRCGQAFSWYGALYVHEQEKSCTKPRQSAMQRRAAKEEIF